MDSPSSARIARTSSDWLSSRPRPRSSPSSRRNCRSFWPSVIAICNNYIANRNSCQVDEKRAYYAQVNGLLTRRNFLERATCAGALLAVARPAAAAGAMYVSLNGSLTQGVSGADKIRLAAAVGYGGVDWDLGPAKTAGREATQALFADLKVRPSIVNLPMARPLPFGGESEAFQQALTQLADDAAFTAGDGCRKMMLVLPASTTQDRQEQRKLVRDRLAGAADVLHGSQIRPALEFLGPVYMRMGRAGRPPATPFVWNFPDTHQP